MSKDVELSRRGFLDATAKACGLAMLGGAGLAPTSKGAEASTPAAGSQVESPRTLKGTWPQEYTVHRDEAAGHLVLSTIHTNSAVGVIPRLIDMGIDPYLIAPTLILAIGQRLTRKLCPNGGAPLPIVDSLRVMVDKQFSDLPEKYRNELDLTDTVYSVLPTSDCPTGMRGRMAVLEVLEMDKEIEELILKNATEVAITKLVRSKGMLTMKEDAIIKAMHREIPFEEVNTL